MNTLDLISSHLLSHISEPPSTKNLPPLFVALQGPQGSGKTYVTRQLHQRLTSHPHNLRVAVLSIDDLYLPYKQLRELANTGNPLLRGRGLPGTHDVALGISILDQLKRTNELSTDTKVQIPVFEKSLHDGWGDRSPESVFVQGPLDVVILEGWFVGFHPIEDDTKLQEVWERDWSTVRKVLKMDERHALEDLDIMHIFQTNDALKPYVAMWDLFDIFIQLTPHMVEKSPASYCSGIYNWRLQQEHEMKASNGGRGMSDEDVVRFVDRYIPGYIFFLDTVHQGVGTSNVPVNRPWTGRSLAIAIDTNRTLTSSYKF